MPKKSEKRHTVAEFKQFLLETAAWWEYLSKQKEAQDDKEALERIAAHYRFVFKGLESWMDSWERGSLKTPKEG